MLFNEAFPSTYISQADIPQPRVVTIKAITLEDIKTSTGMTERKSVLHLHEIDRPMVLNKTNAEAIMAICRNPDMNSWVGTVVELFVDSSVSFGGKSTGGLRLRAPTQPQSQQGQPQQGQPQQDQPQQGQPTYNPDQDFS